MSDVCPTDGSTLVRHQYDGATWVACPTCRDWEPQPDVRADLQREWM